jgi:hypothetical protein
VNLIERVQHDPTGEQQRRLRRSWREEHPAEASRRRRLRRRFPDLLRHLGDVPSFTPDEEPLGRWGLEFGRGWLPLFRALCQRLAQLVPPSRRHRFAITQAKQKFGALRLHMSHSSARMNAAIEEARERSTSICEDCGKPGAMHDQRGWVHVLCETHARRRRDAADRELARRREKMWRGATQATARNLRRRRQESRALKSAERRANKSSSAVARIRLSTKLRALFKGTVRDFVDVSAVKRGGVDLDSCLGRLVDELLLAEHRGSNLT